MPARKNKIYKNNKRHNGTNRHKKKRSMASGIDMKYEDTPIKIINNQRDLQDAVDELLSHNPWFLGFDVEWKPNFKKGGKTNKVSLIQIAHKKLIILLQTFEFENVYRCLSRTGFIKKVLANRDIIKCGVGIDEDANKLFNDWNVKMENCVDLNELNLYKSDDIKERAKICSLAKLCQQTCGYAMKYKTKTTSKSNWENRKLSEKQTMYAAEDAITGYLIFDQLITDNPMKKVTAQNIESFVDRRVVNSAFEHYRDKMMKIATHKKYKNGCFQMNDLLKIFKRVNDNKSIKKKYHGMLNEIISYFDDIFDFDVSSGNIKCIQGIENKQKEELHNEDSHHIDFDNLLLMAKRNDFIPRLLKNKMNPNANNHDECVMDYMTDVKLNYSRLISLTLIENI